MRRLYIIVFLIVIYFFSLIFINEAKAQSCSGSTLCYHGESMWSCVGGGPNTGQDCGPGPDPFTCTHGDTCWAFPWCDSANSINASCGGAPGCGAGCGLPVWCVISNSCTYVAPTPTPGGGGPTPTNSPTSTPTPTPTPAPSCSVSFAPDPINIGVGEVANVTVNVFPVPPGSPIDRVDFAIGNPAIATINPNTDSTFPYQTTVTGVSPGATELRATVIMGGVSACGYGTAVDPAPDNVNVSNASSWWQVVNGDVIVNSDIISPIPTSCSLPVCDPAFIVTPLGGFPGIPSYHISNTFDVSAGIPPGTVSSTGWLTEANYSAQTDYNYAFFENLVPGDTSRNPVPGGTVGVGELISGGGFTHSLSPDGYFWYFKSGDLSLNRQLIGSNKMVLFVAGDLTIKGEITLNDGTGFFMAIVSGNITVEPSVNVAGDDLEGIFVANGNFTTSSVGAASDDPIQIRGMVAAYGQVDPNRDLPDNSATPAELYKYAPDLLFNMPPSLQLKRTRWKEVAP